MSVYLEAIKVLEARGWVQGTYFKGHRDSGPVCVHRAIAIAQGSPGLLVEDWTPLTPLSRVVGQDSGDDVEKFNDDPHTSYEDIVLALKRAHEASEAAL